MGVGQEGEEEEEVVVGGGGGVAWTQWANLLARERERGFLPTRGDTPLRETSHARKASRVDNQ